MEIRPKGYDSNLNLRELLSGISPDKLVAALSALIGKPVRLVAANNCWSIGPAISAVENMHRLPLIHDLETIGFIETTASDESRLKAAISIMESLMRSGARYFMASEMHIEVVQADYEELQRRHEALQDSESRYKALSENLETRVKEQVATIDTTQRQLYQAEKLASVGQLAAGVAHEINNPIGFIRSNLGTANSYVQKFQTFAAHVNSCGDAKLVHAWQTAELDFILNDFRALLKESIDGADRVARIVTDLKGFSSVDQSEENDTDLNESLRSVCNVAASQISNHADLELSLEELPLIHCKSGHLGQVFLNLILNALQAMQTRGKLRISSRLENDNVVFRFADNGRGIPTEVLPRIFDPFFTTHDVGSGTGLGLTVSRDIVGAHGGEISVESEPGSGTIFTIRLPITRGDI